MLGNLNSSKKILKSSQEIDYLGQGSIRHKSNNIDRYKLGCLEKCL